MVQDGLLMNLGDLHSSALVIWYDI